MSGGFPGSSIKHGNPALHLDVVLDVLRVQQVVGQRGCFGASNRERPALADGVGLIRALHTGIHQPPDVIPALVPIGNRTAYRFKNFILDSAVNAGDPVDVFTDTKEAVLAFAETKPVFLNQALDRYIIDPPELGSGECFEIEYIPGSCFIEVNADLLKKPILGAANFTPCQNLVDVRAAA